MLSLPSLTFLDFGYECDLANLESFATAHGKKLHKLTGNNVEKLLADVLLPMFPNLKTIKFDDWAVCLLVASLSASHSSHLTCTGSSVS